MVKQKLSSSFCNSSIWPENANLVSFPAVDRLFLLKIVLEGSGLPGWVYLSYLQTRAEGIYLNLIENA